MTTFDCPVYEEAGKWHFMVLKLMTQRGAGASSLVFDSRSDKRRGYATKKDANKASEDFKARPSILLPHSV
ncbi:MAG: hypothetical protein ABL935_05660 [Nitrospiraceae bacterium]